MRRVGLLGGTFDPPHVGHLWLGEAAQAQLGLDEVWFLPVGDPVHKRGRAITAVSHRIQMTQAAIQTNPQFKLSTLDTDRPPPHTTISLLQLLHKQHPDTQFRLLIGGDSLRDFASWANPTGILELCRLGVLARPNAVVDWDGLETAVSNLKSKVDWIDAPPLDLSSTDIRQRLRAGQTVRYLLHPDTLLYIQKHALYQA